MSEAQNKALAQRIVDEILNQHDLSVINEIFSPDFRSNGRHIGREGFKHAVAGWINSFPDFHLTVGPLITEGDLVGFFYTARGTHQRKFMGFEPTGRQVEWTGADFWRIEGGRVVEAWLTTDRQAILHQLQEPRGSG
ncbi:MAG: hypothetical protein Kow00120_22930 [Anaerolineae bacterium]